MKYVFIVNGMAGKESIRTRLAEQLKQNQTPFEYEIYATKAKRDATSYVAECCQKAPEEEICFVACGGDGTINEVVNGVMHQPNKCFAVLAFGTGNDFVKYYPDRNFLSLEQLLKGKKQKIDAIRVNNSYAINVVNFGFESIVCSNANRLKEHGYSGKSAYVRSIPKALFSGRRNAITIWADGEKITKDRMLLCTFANCKFVGGQYQCAPLADNSDGWMEVCLMHPMSLLRFLRMIGYYERGEHLKQKGLVNHCVYRRAKTAKITSQKVIEACLDGEMYAGTEFDLEILPRAVEIVLPQA